MEHVKQVYTDLFFETSYPDSCPLFQRTFMPLKVEGCNGSGAWSFSDASVDVSSGSSGVSEVFAFRGAVQTMLKSRTCQNILTRDQKEAFIYRTVSIKGLEL